MSGKDGEPQKTHHHPPNKKQLIQKVKDCLSNFMPKEQIWPDEDIWEFLKKSEFNPELAASAIIQVPESKRPQQWQASNKKYKKQLQAEKQQQQQQQTSATVPAQKSNYGSGSTENIQRRNDPPPPRNQNSNRKPVPTNINPKTQYVNSKFPNPSPKQTMTTNNRLVSSGRNPTRITENKTEVNLSTSIQTPLINHHEQRHHESAPIENPSTNLISKSPPETHTEIILHKKSDTPSEDHSPINDSSYVNTTNTSNTEIFQQDINLKSSNRKAPNDSRSPRTPVRTKQKPVWKVKQQSEQTTGHNDSILENPPITNTHVLKGSQKNRSGGVVILAAFGDEADCDVDFGDDLNHLDKEIKAVDITSNQQPALHQQSENSVLSVGNNSESLLVPTESPSTSPPTTSNPLPTTTNSIPPDRRLPIIQGRPHNSPPNVEPVALHPFLAGQYPNVFVPPVSTHVPSHLMYPFDQLESMPGFYEQYLHPSTYGHHGLMSSDGASHMGVPQAHLSSDGMNIRDSETPPAPGFNNSHDNQEDTPAQVPNSVNLQSITTVAPGIPLPFGIGPAVLPVGGQPMASQHQSMAHALPYSQSGMYPYYPQAPYSASQPPNPNVMPLVPHRFLISPPKSSYVNQPQYGPNPPPYEDIEGFSHKAGVTGNHPGYIMPPVLPFPQGPVDQVTRGPNRTTRVAPSFKGQPVGIMKQQSDSVAVQPTTVPQGQQPSITTKSVHEQISEGSHPGILYTQPPIPVNQRKIRTTFPEDFHPSDYYLSGQPPPPASYQSYHFGSYHPVHMTRIPQYGPGNTTNSPLQRHHDNSRGVREGDGQSQ